jgi:DNA-directed RNA polymerase subunit RPC12/RpoP
MIKFADYKCPHCGEEVQLQLEVTAPRWDELYAEQTCPLCSKQFDGKAHKLMTRAAPEVKYLQSRLKGRMNSKG